MHQFRLGLYLMTEKGRSVLSGLLPGFRNSIAWVVSGRDQSLDDDGYKEIKRTSTMEGIPFYDRLESPAEDVAYAFAVSWRWIINTGSTRLIVVHDSLLPKHRGFNPLVTALINGDEHLGATALWATEEYDRGEIIAQRSRAIEYPMKISQAISLMSEIYVELVLDLCRELKAGRELSSTSQDENHASYSLWRDAEDYQLDWSRSAEVLRRQIDAQGSPYAGASCLMGDRRVRILAAEAVEDVVISNRQPGKVIFLKAGIPTVVCGKGLLRITDARFADSGEPALPLLKFRTRLA